MSTIRKVWIDDGVNINAAWESHIVISNDGTNWNVAEHKEGLTVDIVPYRGGHQVTFKRSTNRDVVFQFDPAHVPNKPAWDAPGTSLGKAIAAVTEILTWFPSAGSGSAGLATEATLQSVLSAIQDGQDFEAKSVVDATDTTYLEIRLWNSDTQTWETPLYYAPGSNTGVAFGTLTAPVTYLNPQTTLSSILSQLTTLNTVDFATETTLEAARVLLASIDANTDGS